MSGRADGHFHQRLDGSFSHSLLDTSFSLSQALRVADELHASLRYRAGARSVAGLQAWLRYTAQSASSLHSHHVSGDGSLEGSFRLGSLHINGSHTHSYDLRPADGEGRGECTVHLSSPSTHIDQRTRAVYAHAGLDVVSKTSSDNDLVTHEAELHYRDARLSLSSRAAARAMRGAVGSRAELAVSAHRASLTVETQAHGHGRNLSSVWTGSLDPAGLQITTEGALMLHAGCNGLHRASVTVSKKQLSANVSESGRCGPVAVELLLRGAADASEATVEVRASAGAADSRAAFNTEGKLTPQEASLTGVLTGHVYDTATRNDVNIVLNRRALIFTSNIMAAMKEMTTEHSHSLTLTLWTLTLLTQSRNVIHEDVYYEHQLKADLKPFLLSCALRNDLKVHGVTFRNEGSLKLEPLKAALTGRLKGAGGGHSLAHAYNLTYDNNHGTVQSHTAATVMNAQLTHKCRLALAGFASASHCVTQIFSEPLRLDGSIRTVAVPFRLTVDALVKSDADIRVWGNHSGQLDSKWLFRAEPLALAHSLEGRLRTLHTLHSQQVSTSINSTFDGLLTTSDQSLTWGLRLNLNDSVYSQDTSLYNDPMKVGFNVSCLLMTDVLNKPTKASSSGSRPEELRLSAGLKYRKSRACPVAGSPFTRNFLSTLEQLRDTLAQALESLQQHINNSSIHQLLLDFKVTLKQLPMQVRDFIQGIDLEQKINQVKAKLDYLMNGFTVRMEDLESGMNKFWKKMENVIMEISESMEKLAVTSRGYVESGQFAAMVTGVLARIEEQLQAFDTKFGIKQSLVNALDAAQEFFKHMEIRLKELRKPDSTCVLLQTAKNKTLEMKETVETFDITSLVQSVKDHFLSVEWAVYVDQLSYQTSYSQISERIETMSEVISNWVDEYEISNKLNVIYFYIRDLLLKYGLDESFKEMLDQVGILIKEFRIEETVQLLVDALKSINVDFIYEKLLQFLHQVTAQVKSIDFRGSVHDLNRYMSSGLKSIKDFDYGAFVDEINENIVSLTNHINEQLKRYDVVQKIEAGAFFREMQSSLYSFLDELRHTKMSDAFRKLGKVIETTLVNDIKMKAIDLLQDVRQRVSDMDIREEIYFYLHRAGTSYANVVAFISEQFHQLLERIQHLAKRNGLMTQVKESAVRVLDALTGAELKVPAFVVALTDLVIPEFTINLNKLQELQIPAQISVPGFTILNRYHIPGFTIDFDQLKARILLMIDNIREFHIRIPEPEAIFGDLKVLYLFQLPDFTFPEITLSEITFPAINIPTLNLTDFQSEEHQKPEVEFPDISSHICMPVLGKLEGELQVNIPQYTLVTTAKMENATSALGNPRFTVLISSQATSPFEFLDHSFEATAHLDAPTEHSLLFTQTLRATHTSFSVHHQGSITVSQRSAQASAHSATRVTTPVSRWDLIQQATVTVIPAHASVQVRCEMEVPSLTRSLVVLNGEADPGDWKALLTASHSTEFTGNVIGSMKNTVEASVRWFEIVLNVENRVNTKILFPLKLTGKVDLQQDYRVLLTADRQTANWFALARFNQYTYNSNVTAENNEMELYVHLRANGEASLAFLTVPLSLPNMTIPYFHLQTPGVEGVSLWDYAGFRTSLSSPHQSFETNQRLVYSKNPDPLIVNTYLNPV